MNNKLDFILFSFLFICNTKKVIKGLGTDDVI